MANVIKCPKCNKIAVEVSRTKFGHQFMVKLKCGDSLITKQLEHFSEVDEFESYLTHDKPYPFQLRSLEFIEKSTGRALIAHEQGLGKTIITLLALRAHPEMLPALVVCKSNLSIQWFKAGINWLDKSDNTMIQIVTTGKDFILPNCQIYIISYDLLRRLPPDKKALFESCPTLIVDECQNIKNPDSIRAKNVRAISRDKQYILALSGTPIKNNAGEYFSILNILRPTLFPTENGFNWEWVDSYWDGYKQKKGGLRNPERFREITKDFILRYEQKDVLPDLPELRRNFQYYDIDTDLRESYNKVVDELADFMKGHENGLSFAAYASVLPIITKLRQIVGFAKVQSCADYVIDFLNSTDRKITIFVHHHLVRDSLDKVLTAWCNENDCDKPLILKSELNPEERDELVTSFEKDARKRIMIASTLSSGEGLNLQFCDEVVMLERQWNPANENQAEKRFHRIGQLNHVNVEYFIAVGTVDEMLTELIEQKRQNIGQAMFDKDVAKWSETNIVREMINAILQKRGGKKWSIGIQSSSQQQQLV